MAAAKGNQYHKGMHEGKPKKFATPEEFKTAIQKYFDWCDNHPIMKNDALRSGIDAGRIIQIPTQRPYLIEGLCDFLDIAKQTFYNYESKEEYKDFFDVSAWARNKIYSQNLQFGYTNIFDAGLVARKLSIADKKEMDARVQMPAIIVKNEEEKQVFNELFNKE